MSDPVKITDQVKEGEQRRSTATAKTSTENFTAEEQAQPTEKFTTWSGEEPKKVLLAAKQGETLEEFTARTNKYQEEQAQKAKNKPAIQPFCIGGFEDGSEVKAGEKQKPVEATRTKKEHKVVDDPHPTRMMPAMTPEAEAKIKAEKQTKHEQISQSATLMAIEAGKNPAMQPVALTRQYADSLPDGHPKKQPLTELTREQAAALSPDMRAHYKQFDGGTHKAIAPETLTNTPEGWLTVAQKIAQLPMDKQLQVIGSGLMAGIEQYQHDERERAWGRLIGTVQGTGEVLQGLAKIADFGAACILGDNERAGKMGEEFGAALGQTIIGGVRLFQAADQYLFNIGYTGDYAKPFQDIAAAGQKLDEQWSRLPPREQERIKTKLITEMIESGALGAGGAGAVQKASKFTEVLDALAVEAKQLHAAAKPTIKKAVNAVNNAVDELIQPVGDTGMGMKMPIPKDPLKDETKMLMSKADDLGDQSGRRISKGVDATGKTLSFSEESGIELGAVRQGPDKVWDQAPFPRGDDVHVVLGENLPAGTKTIDRVVFKDGIAEGQKSIDLSAESYALPNKLESKLRGYMFDMQLYEGQPRQRMSFTMKKYEIEEKVLHIGIKDGQMTSEQKSVFEKVGKEIQDYNQNLPIGMAPLKLKVTVVK